MLLVAGCGGGGKEPERLVSGSGYTFRAPTSWRVTHPPLGTQAAASDRVDLVSVQRFPLRHAFRPALWPEVVPELDRAAGDVATQQRGSVEDPRTVTIAGGQARRYDVAYERDGRKLVERIAFVLRGKTEYLLLCRFRQGHEPRACASLLGSFRPA